MRRILIYLLILMGIVVAALFFMPLKLAVSMANLDKSGFSARAISGSIWNGRVEGAQIGPFALGDLDAGLQLFPLLTGTVRMDLERPPAPGDNGLVATIGRQGRGLLIENATTNLSVGEQLAPLPASNIELDAVSAAFADGRCISASGKVRLSLDANIPGLDLQRGLLGDVKCDNGVLMVAMASASDMEQLTLSLEGNGFYTARLLLSGQDRAWTMLLPTLGFLEVPGGYAIKVAGQLGRNQRGLGR